MLHIVTIVDDLSVTSMPVNEFVVYRAEHSYPLKQSIVACCEETSDSSLIPYCVDLYYVGMKINRMRNAIKRILQKCKSEKDNIVIHLHQPKSAFFFFLGSFGLGLKKRTLFTVHSTYSSRNFEYKFESVTCALLSNYVTCVSRSSYEEYSRLAKRIKGRKIVGIVNGVDIDRIDNVVSECDSVKRDIHNIYCVARIIPIKNQKFLIDVIKGLPGYRLILVGAESDSYDIQSYIKEKKVEDQVVLKGLMPRDKVFRELQNGQIYVSASTVEGMPVSVLEAMHLGMIPILSDIKPHREVNEKCNGVILLPPKEEVWINKIKEIASMTEEDRSMLVKSIKSGCDENYSLLNMHDQYMKIYSVLGGSSNA